MNREILFRGKRQDYGVWVEGYYMHNFWNDGGDTIHFPDGGCCEIISETLGQYTGLTDKNGRKIFEGDIVGDAEEGRLYKMIWSQENMRYYIEDENGEQWDFDSNYSISLEVVSNVFDNPELLRGA